MVVLHNLNKLIAVTTEYFYNIHNNGNSKNGQHFLFNVSTLFSHHESKMLSIFGVTVVVLN